MIRQEELERVLARGQVKQDLRLPLPEMSVMIGRRNRQIGGRQLRVDDEMMVSRPGHRYDPPARSGWNNVTGVRAGGLRG